MPLTCLACGAWFPGLGSGGLACRRCGADLGAKPGDGGESGITYSYSVDSSSPSAGRRQGGRDDDASPAGSDGGDGGGGDGGGGGD